MGSRFDCQRDIEYKQRRKEKRLDKYALKNRIWNRGREAEYSKPLEQTSYTIRRVRTQYFLHRAPGVYLIYEKNDPVYVGSSTNIRRRVFYQLLNARNHYFAPHLIRNKFHSKVRFKDYLIRQCAGQYMETEGADEAKWIERFVAGTIRPIYNSGTKSFQND